MSGLISRECELGFLVACALLVPLGGAWAQTLTTLHRFEGAPLDGSFPTAGVTMDANGDLFGTTYYGGKGYKCEGSTQGCGFVFEIAPGGKETKLDQFVKAKKDGSQPWAGLISDASGNLYGATVYGGRGGCSEGCGTVFKLTPDGTTSVLHDFGKKNDGVYPVGTLTQDPDGNLFGTTQQGGAYGYGTVFKLASDGSETVLYSFCSQTGCADGMVPEAGLIFDNAGNLYGTTTQGGAGDYGTVFELTANGTESVLHAFQAGSDGAHPVAGLMMDGSGDLFGTTKNGGGSANCTGGCGTVFEIAAGGTETVIHSFSGASDGGIPYASLIADSGANLYGTASTGGANNEGVIFEIAAGGTETVLYDFCSQTLCTDGAAPYAPLIMDANGNLYGTTTLTHVSAPGTVFEFSR